MKKLPVLLLALLLLLAVPAMAEENGTYELSDTPAISSIDVPILPGVDPDVVSVPDDVTASVFNFDLNFNDASQPAIYTTSYLVVSAEEPRDGLAGLVSSIFGSYTPRTYMTDTVVDGVIVDTVEQYVPGLAGLDYEWIAGVALFGIMLFCFMKMTGGLLK